MAMNSSWTKVKIAVTHFLCALRFCHLRVMILWGSASFQTQAEAKNGLFYQREVFREIPIIHGLGVIERWLWVHTITHHVISSFLPWEKIPGGRTRDQWTPSSVTRRDMWGKKSRVKNWCWRSWFMYSWSPNLHAALTENDAVEN